MPSMWEFFTTFTLLCKPGSYPVSEPTAGALQLSSGRCYILILHVHDVLPMSCCRVVKFLFDFGCEV